MGLAILPLAALLTGTLLTVGIAVLLIVVLTIRRKREKAIQGVDLKEKHIGKYEKNSNPSVWVLSEICFLSFLVATPAGDISVGGQPRYVVAYTLKQTEQKQPDILNPDSLQSIKDMTSKLKPPVGSGGGSSGGETSTEKMMYSSTDYSAMYQTAAVDRITVDGGSLMDTSSYYIQPPHYSILSNNSNNCLNNESPHEYSTAATGGAYSTVIVAQTEPYGSSNIGNSAAVAYNGLLGSVREEDELTACGSQSKYRNSGSDFSIGDCISNTSTLGGKSRTRHIITDTLPGPESCV